MKAITLLKKSGATTAQIAKACDVKRQTVGHWIRGRNGPDKNSYSALINFAAARGIRFIAEDFQIEKK